MLYLDLEDLKQCKSDEGGRERERERERDRDRDRDRVLLPS